MTILGLDCWTIKNCFKKPKKSNLKRILKMIQKRGRLGEEKKKRPQNTVTITTGHDRDLALHGRGLPEVQNFTSYPSKHRAISAEYTIK